MQMHTNTYTTHIMILQLSGILISYLIPLMSISKSDRRTWCIAVVNDILFPSLEYTAALVMPPSSALMFAKKSSTVSVSGLMEISQTCIVEGNGIDTTGCPYRSTNETVDRKPSMWFDKQLYIGGLQVSIIKAKYLLYRRTDTNSSFT